MVVLSQVGSWGYKTGMVRRVMIVVAIVRAWGVSRSSIFSFFFFFFFPFFFFLCCLESFIYGGLSLNAVDRLDYVRVLL